MRILFAAPDRKADSFSARGIEPTAEVNVWQSRSCSGMS